MIVGFTGTREGMSPEQKRVTREIISQLITTSVHTAVHGDCIGADTDFHHIIREILPNVTFLNWNTKGN